MNLSFTDGVIVGALITYCARAAIDIYRAHVPRHTECDHVYFPVMDGNKPVGQQCALCSKYNSLRDLGMDEQ